MVRLELNLMASRRITIPEKQRKPEEIVGKLRQIDVLVSEGMAVADAVRQIGATEVVTRRTSKRRDCEIFYTLKEARIVIKAWRRHCNAVRPHASLGYRAPAPEVFAPAIITWPSAHAQPALPTTLPLVPRPSLS